MPSINFLNVENIFYIIYTALADLNGIFILNAIIRFLVGLRPYALALSLILIFIIVYSRIRIHQLNKVERQMLFPPKPVGQVSDKVQNEKWLKVENHINSPNPNDWRMAVVEADIMLGELLRSKGLTGDSIGEMLKGLERSDMLTLDHAWDAHKARNQIAHEGSDFHLNEREAKRIIELYRQVFQEFRYI